MKKCVHRILLIFLGVVAGIRFAEKVLSAPLRNLQGDALKFQMQFRMMGKWVELEQKGISLPDYFRKRGYRNIAIYGMGLSGLTLYNELKGTDIAVAYAIDRNKEEVPNEVDVYLPKDTLPDADAIIVSAVASFEEIAQLLKGKVECPVISLEDIIYQEEGYEARP